VRRFSEKARPAKLFVLKEGPSDHEDAWGIGPVFSFGPRGRRIL
jgi:hypothetical protein